MVEVVVRSHFEVGSNGLVFVESKVEVEGEGDGNIIMDKHGQKQNYEHLKTHIEKRSFTNRSFMRKKRFGRVFEMSSVRRR